VALGVTAIGRGDRQTIVVVNVAKGAGHVRMPTGEQESSRAVIEGSRRPADGVVTRRAVRGRERGSRRGMNGIGRLLPVGQVALRIAAIGGRNRQRIVVIDVA